MEAVLEIPEEQASLPELLLGLWLEHLEMEGRGVWRVSDQYREFVLNEEATVVFLLGQTPEGKLFLGAGPEIADWFLDLDWRYVMCKDSALRLCLRYEEDDFFLVVPMLPVLFTQMPQDARTIELATLDVTEEQNGVVEYERVKTREIPYHYRGGDQ